MKSSDLKVVAIILSIALFFTIVASNAVSVASVVMLVKGGGTSTASATTAGGSATDANGNAAATDANGNTAVTDANGNTAVTDANGNTATTAAAGGNTVTTAASGKGSSSSSSSGAMSTKEGVYNFYKAAVLKIKNNAAAGYSRKEWQKINSINIGNSALENIVKSFVKSEDQAVEKVNAKGSSDAKNRFPNCGAPISKVKSATCNTVNGQYQITIVMNEEVNPAKGSNGIASMSTGILYLEDVRSTIASNGTVKALVRSLDDSSKIDYKSYTITATMTKDGKFVTMKHVAIGDITASAKLLIGSINGTGELVFTSSFYNFKY